MNATETIGIGTVLGGFEIEQELGKGGMGVVYKAHESSLNRKVALKVLSQALSTDHEFITRFRKEAQIVANLNHPNIVRVLAFGNELGHYYFAMEYIKGTDLGKILKSKTVIPLTDAMAITRQIAEALSEAGPRGIVHRDLKPSNIMIDETNRVRVTDFGVAHVEGSSDGLTQTGMFLGTPEYASPEQAMGKRVDMRSDIYAMGALLYRMLSGKPPIIADSPLAVVAKIATEPVTPIGLLNSSVPQPVCDLIEKMMAKKAAERFQTPAQALVAIDACIKAVEMDDGMPGGPTVFEHAAPPSRPPRKGVASARVWGGVALLIVIVLVGLYVAKDVFFTSGSNPESVSVAVEAKDSREEKNVQPEVESNVPAAPAVVVPVPPTVEKAPPPSPVQDAVRPATGKVKPVTVASTPQPSSQPPMMPMPDSPTVLLMVSGVEEMTPLLRTHLESALLDSGLQIISPAEIPMLREKMQWGNMPINWYDIKQFVPGGEAHILVLATIQKAGSTMLTFYGQSQEQITASFSVRSLDMTTGKAVDRTATGVVRYTALNIHEEFADAVPDAVGELGTSIDRYWQKKKAVKK